jgi:hypothetical protein
MRQIPWKLFVRCHRGGINAAEIYGDEIPQRLLSYFVWELAIIMVGL